MAATVLDRESRGRVRSSQPASGSIAADDPSSSIANAILEQPGDTLTAQEPYKRWWSVTSVELHEGEFTLTASLSPDQWTSVFGQGGAEVPNEFNAAISQVANVGFTFGGAFAGHGVYVTGGNARFILKQYSVSQNARKLVTYATACTARQCCIASSAGDAYYTSTLSFGCCGVSPLNILVTGGAGYVGSHACKALAAKGYVPITYDNLSRGNIWAVKWGPLEKGDIADGQRIRAVLEKYRPRALMHFAAYAYVGESVEQPLLYYGNNFTGTAVLLQTAVDYHCIPIVFSSSCATYGLPERVPIAEDHPQHPINSYGHSKLFVERMLADLNVACGLPSIALRYFNAAGADPDGEIGEAHDPETHLIPLVLAAARAGTPVRIFGNDYDTPDGSCVRDYVPVTDIADAHVQALEYLLNGGGSCALNLANERGCSVKEVIAAAETVCHRSIRSETAARRPGDPPVLIGNASRAHALLGWKPTRSNLEMQIADAWRWMKSRELVGLRA